MSDYDFKIFGKNDFWFTIDLGNRQMDHLKPTNIVEGRLGCVHHEPPGPERWKNRSRTFPGIANAMAEQWG